jgi:hypothetical protein
MRKLLILLTLYGLLYHNGQSQTDSLIKGKIGISLETNIRNYNFKSLNNELNIAGFNELLEFEGYSIGISDRDLNKNSYATVKITWIQSNRTDSSRKAYLDILELSSEMHWVLTKSQKWFLYPSVGFGTGYSFLSLSQKIENRNFTSSIQNLTSEDRYVKRYFSKSPLLFLNVGAGLDRKIHILPYDFYIGLNLGYRLSTNSSFVIQGSPLNRYNCFELNGRVRVEFNKKIIKSRPRYFKYIN